MRSVNIGQSANKTHRERRHEVSAEGGGRIQTPKSTYLQILDPQMRATSIFNKRTEPKQSKPIEMLGKAFDAFDLQRTEFESIESIISFNHSVCQFNLAA